MIMPFTEVRLNTKLDVGLIDYLDDQDRWRDETGHINEAGDTGDKHMPPEVSKRAVAQM